MYKVCRTEQSFQRQRQLEQGLLKLMLITRYEDISISDLCDRLQIPRKSFYRYFSGKEGALYALVDHTMMDFYGDSEHGPVPGTPREDLCRFFAFWYDNKQLLDALTRNGLTAVLTERATVLVRQEGLYPKSIVGGGWVRQELVLSFALSGLFSMVLRWHEMGFPVSPTQMSDIAVAMLSRPLFQI